MSSVTHPWSSLQLLQSHKCTAIKSETPKSGLLFWLFVKGTEKLDHLNVGGKHIMLCYLGLIAFADAAWTNHKLPSQFSSY